MQRRNCSKHSTAWKKRRRGTESRSEKRGRAGSFRRVRFWKRCCQRFKLLSCLSWRGIFHGNWENKSKFQIGGLREAGGLLLFSPVRAHLLTTLKGSGISCGNRALCEADAAAAAASRQCHSTCRVLLSSSAQVAVVSALETACTLPAQTCHRQLCLRLCPKLIFGAFSLLRKRNRKRKNEVKKIWRFIIWKRRWSAGAQAAPQ